MVGEDAGELVMVITISRETESHIQLRVENIVDYMEPKGTQETAESPFSTCTGNKPMSFEVCLLIVCVL